MALSWSMDKIGPICRSAEDCAIVLSAIHGPDGSDPSVHDYGFTWNPNLDLKTLRIGYLKTEFDREPNPPTPDESTLEEKIRTQRANNRANRKLTKAFDDASINVLQNKLGLKLIPVELPKFSFNSIRFLLTAEAAAAFDDLTRSGRDKLLTGQEPFDWPNAFRVSRFIPAVEYINANRARTLGMMQTADLFKTIDLFVAPTNSGQLVMTNLTGHPAIILPNGFRGDDAPVPATVTDGGGSGTPSSFTLVGNLFAEAKLLAVAKAYQDATDFHLKHPKL
jgi:Asp-tRNA(Asn)/Glu-tRNA(Gln) amidotransferase A subunit family amidase